MACASCLCTGSVAPGRYSTVIIESSLPGVPARSLSRSDLIVVSCAARNVPPASDSDSANTAVFFIAVPPAPGRCSAPARALDHAVIERKVCGLLPSRNETVLHVEHATDLTCADFGNLAIRRAVDDAEQHRSAALYDDVNWVAADRLHAREAPLISQVLQHSVYAARRVSGEEVIGINAIERSPADPVVVLGCRQHFDFVGHFGDAARTLHGQLRVRFQSPFKAVAGEVDSAALDSEHDVVEHAVVGEALEHAPHGMYCLFDGDTLRHHGRWPADRAQYAQTDETHAQRVKVSAHRSISLSLRVSDRLLSHEAIGPLVRLSIHQTMVSIDT